MGSHWLHRLEIQWRPGTTGSSYVFVQGAASPQGFARTRRLDVGRGSRSACRGWARIHEDATMVTLGKVSDRSLEDEEFFHPLGVVKLPSFVYVASVSRLCIIKICWSPMSQASPYGKFVWNLQLFTGKLSTILNPQGGPIARIDNLMTINPMGFIVYFPY